ncbi:MAG: protein phosphatase 2C domain-containing protein [Propionibacteriaceae bacterium]|jgi:protein phosphatase|nr:protein phosphatase 2C domain-containing protein [Propionibacteriaceae bacterium]
MSDTRQPVATADDAATKPVARVPASRAKPRLTLRHLCHSEVGLVRKNNQDSAYASSTMLLVADGMGGAAAGDLASAIVVNQMRNVDGQYAGTEMLAAFDRAVTRASDVIAEVVESNHDLEGMGSTVSGVLFDGSQLAVVNVGDSRTYLYRDGSLQRLTHDHSFVQTLIDDGRISEEESLTHPHRSLILRVINGQPQHQPDLRLHEAREGDRLLVCSDGLCGMVTDKVIERHMEGSRESVVEALLREVYQTGAQDNVTIVLADVVSGTATVGSEVVGAAERIDLGENEHTGRIRVVDDAEPRPDPGFAETARYSPVAKRGALAWAKIVAAIVVPLALLAGGGALWYSYTQQQYFVGDNLGTVAVFRGVPDAVLHLPLSSVVRSTDIKLADLPRTYRERVGQTISLPSLDQADDTIGELRQRADACILRRSGGVVTPSSSPTSSPAAGTDSAGATSAASGGATASPDATGATSSGPISASTATSQTPLTGPGQPASSGPSQSADPAEDDCA